MSPIAIARIPGITLIISTGGEPDAMVKGRKLQR